MSITLIVILTTLAVLVLWIVFVYNRLITLTNRTKEAWADIDVQLKRRYNLIPNLVEAVQGYAKHERETFQNVTEARSVAMGGGTIAEQGKAENMLTGALKSLFAVSESYPDLKANQNFLDLQNELSDTEDKIQASRRFYNGNVRDLNTSIQSFPGNIIANSFHFAVMNLFELEDGSEARKVVKVKF